ncbi:MAG: acyltransferase family protein [Spirulina sp.]
MKPESKNQHKTLNLLQLFRGLAAIAVALFHVDQLTNAKLNAVFCFDIFKFGWSGVDYFLVLSGFIIIYTQHHNLLQRSPKRFKEFLLKRGIRIYPIYWIITLGVVFFFILIPGFKSSYPVTLGVLIESLLLFPPSAAILNVSWTLTFIVFFYVIFSLNYILSRRVFFTVVGIIIIGSTTQFLSVFAVSMSEKPWISLFFNSLHFEFIFGCIAAYCVLKHSLRYRKTIFCTGVGLLLFFSFSQTYGLIHEVNVISLLGVEFNINRVIFAGIPCLFLVMGAASLDIHESVKIPKFLIYLGNASYSIYLIHNPVISALMQLSAKLKLLDILNNTFILGWLIAIIAVGLSCIFYSLVEKPLTHYLRKQLIQKQVSPARS